MRELEIINMRLGEKKEISILIAAQYGGTFEVTNATWALLTGDSEESNGECSTRQLNDSECIVSAVVEPLRKNAMYKLEFWYDVYPKQRLSYTCLVRVM